jgi:hypothetical protein
MAPVRGTKDGLISTPLDAVHCLPTNKQAACGRTGGEGGGQLKTRELVGKPTPGTEIIDEGEGKVNFRGDCVPYVVSQPQDVP